MSAANPTSASLWAGRVFTTLVFALVLLGAVAGLSGLSGGLVASLLIAAGLIYMVGAIILFMRRDYIMRLFGCAWPLILPKVDELQLSHRQKAFSVTFAIFTSVFSLGMGVQVGVMLTQLRRGDEVTGLLPTQPDAMLVVLSLILIFLTLMPQAYLAWTLTPLDDEEPA
jgi:hypothetical protein